MTCDTCGHVLCLPTLPTKATLWLERNHLLFGLSLITVSIYVIVHVYMFIIDHSIQYNWISVIVYKNTTLVNVANGKGKDMMTSSNGTIFRVTSPLCGEFTGPGEFPAQRPVTRSFDVFFDLRPNKRLSKQPWGWWFEMLSWSLWRHRNDI